jgi:hypothetical protein
MQAIHRFWKHLPLLLLTAGLLLNVAGCPEGGNGVSFFGNDGDTGPSGNAGSSDGTSEAEIAAEVNEVLAKLDNRLPVEELSGDEAFTIEVDRSAPADALYGIWIGGTTYAWVVGDLRDDGLDITGVELTTSNRVPIMRQEVRDNGMTMSLPSGDALDIEVQASGGLKFTLVLEISNPPSVIVAYGDREGNVTVDEAASQIYLTPADDYDLTVAKPRPARSFEFDQKLALMAQEQTWCETIANTTELFAGQACNVYSVITGEAPAKVIDALCAAVSNVLTGYERPGDSLSTRRTLAGMRVGLQVLCEIGKSGWKVVSVLRNLSPMQLACTIFTFASNASVALDGRSLADRACNLWGLGSEGVGDGGVGGPTTQPDPNDSSDPNTSDSGPFVYYSLTINVVEGDGTVEIHPIDESYLFQEGERVTLTAIPARNFAFDRWDGDVLSSFEFIDNFSFTMNRDRVIEVYFIDAEDVDTTDTKSTVSSTFDNSDEAWRVIGDAEGGTGEPDWIDSGGNPGSHLSADDDALGGIWYWQAPVKFYGDFSNAYGQTLTFDLKQDSAMVRQITNRKDVILSGGGKTIWLDRLDNPGSGWTSYTVYLDTTESWFMGNSTPAGEDDIRTVLGALDDIQIRGEYEDGNDTGGLDNVVLNAD